MLSKTQIKKYLKSPLKTITTPIKNTSIIMRVTLWYTVFITILIAILISISFSVAKNLSKNSIQQEIVQAVTNISNNPNKFEDFTDGMFFIVYDENNIPIQGRIPKDFSPLLPIHENELQQFTNHGKEYIFYDLQISTDKNKWIRGIVPKHHSSKEVSFFLILMLTISPILIIFIVYGGYRIIKRAFIPVSKISTTALQIKENNDFSKRIPTNDKEDELHKLANTFNQMLDTLESSYLHEKQFNIDVSHELRTPTTVILSESEYGIKYAENLEEAKESFKVINEQSHRMKKLINQIMELSKIESNNTIHMEEINLSELVQTRTKDYIQTAEKKNIRLNVQVENNIHINANQIMIERVIDNLISNAIKFTENKIDVKLYSENNKIKLSVSDNGIGISQENQNKIWNRFYQTDSSRNKNENTGVGLGLSLVQKIVELHNAKIILHSEENHGSLFEIEFSS